METRRGTISFIYFDLGRVLLSLDKEKTARMLLAVSDLSWEKIHKILVEGNIDGEYDRTFWDIVIAFDRGRIYPHEFHSEVSRVLKLHVGFDQFEKIWQSMLVVDQSLLSIIIELRKHGIRTGVISDLCPTHYNRFWELGLCDFFDIPPFFSFMEKRLKREEDGATFAKAVGAANLSPQNILFVDDRNVNILAAKRHGLLTHLYTNPARFLKYLMRHGIKIP